MGVAALPRTEGVGATHSVRGNVTGKQRDRKRHHVQHDFQCLNEQVVSAYKNMTTSRRSAASASVDKQRKWER
jgi:hypothetical protein